MTRDDDSSCSSDEGMKSMVLLCVDAHDTGVRALDWYYDHFHHEDHTIGLVHVYNPPRPGRQSLVYPAELYEKYQLWLCEVQKRSVGIMNKLEEVCLRRGLKCEAFVVEKMGSVGETIVDLAKEKDAEFIVMGQSDAGSAKRIRRGQQNVSEHVLENSHANVIIAPL